MKWRGLLVIILVAIACLQREGSAMIFRPQEGATWDPSVLWHDGKYHAFMMYNKDGRDGLAAGHCLLATSTDGVHWEDQGAIIDERGRPDGGNFFKCFVARCGDKFIMDHGVARQQGQDTLRFHQSRDLRNWEYITSTEPDDRWYRRDRWDHMYMLPKEEGKPEAGYWGYVVAVPKQGVDLPAMMQSPDGLRWEVLPPAKTEWGDTPPRSHFEYGGCERIGGKYYLIGGTGGYMGNQGYAMFTFVADGPRGPFRPDAEAFRLCGNSGKEVSWLAAWARGNGELLISNYASMRSGDRAPWMLPQSQIGPVAQAVCVYLRHDIRLSLGKVRQVMKGLFGLSFVPAPAMRFGQKAARNGAALYEEILEAVRAAAMACADETGMHKDGIGWWVWLACTANLAAFRIDASRSGDAAVALLGEKLNGTLVAADYAAYNRIAALFRQSCLAHPIRIARDLAAELERSRLQYRRTQAIAFCNDVRNLLSDACKAHTRLKSPAARFRAKASYTLQFRALCASPAACDRVETFRNRLLRTLPTLFTFLTVPGVPPTNNAAERALRPIVIFRKTSFGIRSDIGAKELAVMSSLLLSVRLPKGDPLAFTRDLVANNLHKARRAIFLDTS